MASGEWSGGKGSGRRQSQISYKEESIRYDLAFRDEPDPAECKECGAELLITQGMTEEFFTVGCSNCEVIVEEECHSRKEAVIRWNYENK